MRCLIACRDQGVYLLQEFVVMPDHVRLLLTLGDAMMREKAMQLIKGGRVTQVRGHTMQIWQPGFHEWTIRDSQDYVAKSEYIRMNPIRAHLAQQMEDWPYGSACGRFRVNAMPNGLGNGFRG